MLRKLVLLVLIINLLLAGAIWAVYSGAWVWPDSWRGESHEPERLSQQVRPDAIVLKPLSAASSASNPAPKPNGNNSITESKPAANGASDGKLNASDAPTSAPTPASSAAVQSSTNSETKLTQVAAKAGVCLVSMGHDAATASKLSTALKEGIANALNIEVNSYREPGKWMVYMGKYPDAATARKKYGELDKLNMPGDYALIKDLPAYTPGISLGFFRDKERANARLAEVQRNGARSARLVERAPPKDLNWVKLPELDASLRDKATQIVQKVGGKSLDLCTPNT